MDHAQAERLIRRVFSEVIDGGDYSHLDELFDPECIDHGGMGDTHGYEAFTGMLEGFRAAMPGYRHELSDIQMLDDSTAIWQVRTIASFTGELMGARGRGEQVDVWVANAARFRDGRVLEHWGLAGDGLARMLAQMGLEQPAPA